MSKANKSLESEDVLKTISALDLCPHPEGGFFREIFRSGTEPMSSKGLSSGNAGDVGTMTTERKAESEDNGIRNILTSIYWMLTRKHDYGFWIINGSDHVHYHHEGCTFIYYVVHPDGRFETHRLGKNYAEGDKPQLIVPGGAMKCCRLVLEEGGANYGLIGEAVAPGFDFRDLKVITKDELCAICPEAHEVAGDLIYGQRKFDDTNQYYDKPSP